MAIITPDRVLCACTVTTGNITPGSAIVGHLAPSGVTPTPATGDVAYICVQEVDGSGIPNGAWETTKCTLQGDGTWARSTVLESSAANAAVSFSAGTTKRMFMTTPGKRTAPLPISEKLTIGTNDTLPALAKVAFNPASVRLIIGGGYIVPTNLDATNGWFTVGSDGKTLTYITSGTPRISMPLTTGDIVYADYQSLD